MLAKLAVAAALQNKTIIPAFNIPYLPMVEPVVQAIVDENSVAKVQVARLEWEKFESQSPEAVAKEYFKFCKEGYTLLHLDHVPAIDEDQKAVDFLPLLKRALDVGYQSVMIDGSKLDFEDNIKETKRVADVAAALNIPCEAELGKVGGKEDDLEAEADTNTDPQEAKEFVERTGVTSLAVAIGTAHGFYVGTPVLDKERLSEIREVVDIPLVLHGASGLSDEDVSDCVKRGICKVNFATELRAAYSKAVKETFAENENTIDPKAYGKKAIQAVKELVEARMKVCGCDGKAE